MPNNFPPLPVYPNQYDSDATLYLVYNTSETVTTADNHPWEGSIDIKPVGQNDLEIWADNGFANIDGELFYYASVEKDGYGKVNKLTNCARNLGGSKTKFNHIGSEVRGFVVAQHHNQLADAIIRLENFIGYNFTPDQATLDWRIRNLAELSVIFDDYTCPDVVFFYNLVSDDPTAGTVISYSVEIEGSFNSFRIDFGDGSFTTTDLTGTHTYPANTTVDPVVQVSTTNCTIVQSPYEREVANQPNVQTPNVPLEILIPNIPDIPPINIPNPNFPNINIQPPPIVFPCLDIGPLGPINIPSIIVVDPPIPTIIDFGPLPNFCSTINFGPFSLPTLISFGPLPNFCTTINFGPIPEFPSIVIDVFPTFPTLIEFGPFPVCSLINFGPLICPTLISFGPLDVPSVITFGPLPDFPSITFDPPPIPTVINFGPLPNFCSTIEFGPISIPTMIDFGPLPNFCTTINFGPVPEFPTIVIDFPSFPTFPTLIEFGPFPVCSLIEFGPIICPTLIQFGPVDFPTIINFGPLEIPCTVIQFGPINIPTEITFGSLPNFCSVIEFGSIPSFPTIVIDFPSFPTFPTLIEFGSFPVCSLIEFGPIICPTLIEFGPIDIPTQIIFGPINIPTQITFGPLDIPCSVIQFGPPPELPTQITFGPPPEFPTQINFGSFPVCSLIEFGPLNCPTLINFGPLNIPSMIEFGPPPSITVDWGYPPLLSAVVSLVCPAAGGASMAAMSDDPMGDPTMQVDFGELGIPSIIKVVAPVMPDIKIIHDVPALIRVEPFKIPSNIKLTADIEIPSEIKIVAQGLPSEIKVVAESLPSSISIDASNLPNFIRLEVPDDFPRTIKIDASEIPDKIQVVGIPPQIELVGSIPSEIKLVMPDKPEIEMVYKGAPIDVKIELDISKLNGDDKKGNCVAIVPCTP